MIGSRIAVSLLLALLLTGSAFSQVVFVDPNGSGADGDSWATAHTDLPTALADAEGLAEQVWVADGTYTLTADLTMSDNVEVYGGFSGTGGAEETMLSQRDIASNVTIIDVGAADYTIEFLGITGAALDGFTIQDSNTAAPLMAAALATGIRWSNLTFPDLTDTFPGVILVVNSSAVSADRILMTDDGTFGSTAVLVDNSSFDLENSLLYGMSSASGVVAAEGASGSVVSVTNCNFDSNFFSLIADGESDLDLVNTIISNHPSVAVQESSSGAGDVTFNHCVLFSNGADFFDENSTTVNGAANINALAGSANNEEGDPVFANPASGDFTPGPFSSAIDSGLDALAPPLDYAGSPRVDNANFGNGPGGFSDIGALEADGATVPVELSVFGVE